MANAGLVEDGFWRPSLRMSDVVGVSFGPQHALLTGPAVIPSLPGVPTTAPARFFRRLRSGRRALAEGAGSGAHKGFAPWSWWVDRTNELFGPLRPSRPSRPAPASMAWTPARRGTSLSTSQIAASTGIMKLSRPTGGSVSAEEQHHHRAFLESWTSSRSLRGPPCPVPVGRSFPHVDVDALGPLQPAVSPAGRCR